MLIHINYGRTKFLILEDCHKDKLKVAPDTNLGIITWQKLT